MRRYKMYSLEDILARSYSPREIVVSYIDAMELLHHYKNMDLKILGWEGWIKHPDGSLGHSKKFQGTTDLSKMDHFSALALMKSSMMQARTQWESKPEIDGAELLFCISIKS